MILGLDAAKNRTGYALVTYDGVLVTTGVVVIDHSDGDLRTAFGMVRDELVSLDHQAQRECADVVGVFVEAPFAGPSPKVTVGHAMWCGAVSAIAHHVFRHALVELLPPREWRQILGITGKGKEPIREWAVARWPELAGRSQDEMDAACIAEAARQKVEVVE